MGLFCQKQFHVPPPSTRKAANRSGLDRRFGERRHLRRLIGKCTVDRRPIVLCAALDASGIVFIDENGGGPGVGPRKSRLPKKPGSK
jgi:hypothetical protein